MKKRSRKPSSVPGMTRREKPVAHRAASDSTSRTEALLMSETATPTTPPVDRSLFSLHPEEDLPESLAHSEQVNYFKFALQRTLPDAFVARNMAVYWVPGEYEEPWAGPD